jgi:hypothetical protein
MFAVEIYAAVRKFIFIEGNSRESRTHSRRFCVYTSCRTGRNSLLTGKRTREFLQKQAIFGQIVPQNTSYSNRLDGKFPMQRNREIISGNRGGLHPSAETRLRHSGRRCNISHPPRRLRIEPHHSIRPDREVRRMQRLRFERVVSLKVHAKHRIIGINHSTYLHGSLSAPAVGVWPCSRNLVIRFLCFIHSGRQWRVLFASCKN